MTTRRIRRIDPLNYGLQELREAGRVLTKGKYAGGVSKGGWITRTYYPTLVAAGLACLDKEIGDRWNAAQDAGDPLAAIQPAADRTKEIVSEALSVEAAAPSGV